MSKFERIEITHDEWLTELKKRYPAGNPRFRCPICGHVASQDEYLSAGAVEGMVGFSCIGRLVQTKRIAIGGSGSGPCNYAGGGLFAMNPIRVIGLNGSADFFDFADDPLIK